MIFAVAAAVERPAPSNVASVSIGAAGKPGGGGSVVAGARRHRVDSPWRVYVEGGERFNQQSLPKGS